MINKEIYFDDLSQFWVYAMQDSRAYTKSSRNDNYGWGGNSNWQGGLSWDQAKVMALTGWQEGMREIEKYRAAVFPLVASKVIRPRPVSAVAGYNVEVGKYLANDPECFVHRAFEEKPQQGRILKLVCSISVSAAIKPATIIQRGAMICALIDALEFAGHRVEVICNDAMSGSHSENARKGLMKSNGWMEISVVVKKSDQPLEMTDLAFCLAHPAMLRRIMFSVCEIEGWSDFSHCYGYPAQATDKGDLYLEEVFSGTVPDAQAIDWIIDQLKQLSITIEAD